MMKIRYVIVALLIATMTLGHASFVCAEQPISNTDGEISVRKTKKKVVVVKKKPLTKATKPGRLSKKEYYKALQHPKWQKKRLKIFERDKWKCRGCGDTETTLHVHHLTYTKKYPWNELQKNLITYCSRCHARAHGKKEVIR